MKELPTWAGPDVIIAATMSKLDGIVAAASAQVSTCQSVPLLPSMNGLQILHTVPIPGSV